jgi:hypothetical protein
MQLEQRRAENAAIWGNEPDPSVKVPLIRRRLSCTAHRTTAERSWIVLANAEQQKSLFIPASRLAAANRSGFAGRFDS